jgi:hypothetical protein
MWLTYLCTEYKLNLNFYEGKGGDATIEEGLEATRRYHSSHSPTTINRLGERKDARKGEYDVTRTPGPFPT